jgi:deoxyhypusine synthase
MPIINQMHDEQDAVWQDYVSKVSFNNEDDQEEVCATPPFKWSPSNIICRLGQEIHHPESILYWVAKTTFPLKMKSAVKLIAMQTLVLLA